MKKLQRQAFTLVELIVVITILAILGTIAFISFQNYSKNARDGVRVADINNIEKSLGIFITEKGFYPIPDYGTHITYSGALVRTQGTAGDNVTTNLRNLSKKPVDPLTGNEYTYSVANNNVEYQVATILEGGSMVYNLPVTNQANAAMTKKATAKVKGTYNEKILKVSTGGLNYILAVPSIINSNIGRADLQDLINNKELVFNNYENLPDSYKNLGYTMTGGFDYNPSGIVVYTGSMTELCSSGTVQQQFVKNLQTVYQNTIISSESEIKEIIFAITPAQQQLLAGNYIDNHIGGITGTNTVVTVVETDTQQQGTFVSNCTANGQIIYTDGNGVEIGKVSKTGVTISGNPGSLTCDGHIIVCNDNNAGYILQACNVGATGVGGYTETNGLTSHESFGNYYQFGKSNTGWTSGIGYNDGDWKSPGGTNAGSANDWGVLDANKDISTWLNSDTMSRIKMQGPCPINYHIPTKAEWVVIYTIGGWYNGSGIPVSNALKLPVAGARWYNGNFQLQGSDGNYWSSSPLTTAGHYLYFRNDAVSPSSNATRNLGLSVRCMKNINGGGENNSCASSPGYEHATYTTGLPTQPNQVWQTGNYIIPCYYTCTDGYTGINCSEPPEIKWCEPNPGYSNTIYTVGSPTEENQPWQNYDSGQACYYECTNGYTGYYCDELISCAPNPGYSNTIYTVGSPTEVNQPWQNYDSGQACYYECESGYSGDYCENQGY